MALDSEWNVWKKNVGRKTEVASSAPSSFSEPLEFSPPEIFHHTEMRRTFTVLEFCGDISTHFAGLPFVLS